MVTAFREADELIVIRQQRFAHPEAATHLRGEQCGSHRALCLRPDEVRNLVLAGKASPHHDICPIRGHVDVRGYGYLSAALHVVTVARGDRCEDMHRVRAERSMKHLSCTPIELGLRLISAGHTLKGSTSVCGFALDGVGIPPRVFIEDLVGAVCNIGDRTKYSVGTNVA
eukprot:229270-Prymnesium_polylepis.1